MTCCPPWDPPWWYQFRHLIWTAAFAIPMLTLIAIDVYRNGFDWDFLWFIPLTIVVALETVRDRAVSAFGGKEEA